MISNRNSQARRRTRRRGFTLLEMMVVVGIIALIVGAAVVGIGGAFGEAQTTRAQADIQNFKTALMMYRMKHGNYPKTNEGLDILVEQGYLESVPLDPWKQPYVYQYPAKINRQQGAFDVYSEGPDPESKTDNIGNWAMEEGS